MVCINFPYFGPDASKWSGKRKTHCLVNAVKCADAAFLLCVLTLTIHAFTS
jgi:hypothetical protein